MKTLVFLIFSAITATTIQARIGENAEQLVKRYGTPMVTAGTEVFYFKKNDIYITASLWKGVCHCICFSNYPPNAYSLGDQFVLPDNVRTRLANEAPTAPLAEDQIQKLLEANGGGSKWERDQSSGWHTKNGWYLARLNNNTLRIESKEYSQRKPEGKDQPKYDPAKRVDGF